MAATELRETNMNEDFIEIELEEEPIELCNLLKVLDLVETGGQAKALIGGGYVGVNYEICTIKRKNYTVVTCSLLMVSCSSLH